jgi:hypothetical protein
MRTGDKMRFNLCDDLKVSVLEFMELDIPDLEALTSYFPEGGHNRARMEYRLETQRLLEEREMHYIKMMARDQYPTLRNVPLEHRTADICYVALNRDFENNFGHVPGQFKTREMCERSVDVCPFWFNTIPDQFKTRAMCKKAVRAYACNLVFVPEDLLDREMCLWAINHSDWALKYIPVAKRTVELCWLAVANFGPVLEFVPEELKTWKMCQLAIRKNKGKALRFVPERFKTKSLCWLAFTRNWNGPMAVMHLIPEQFQDEFVNRIEARQNFIDEMSFYPPYQMTD